MESHGSRDIDGRLLVGPGDTGFDRNRVARPAAAYCITNEILGRNTFDTPSEAKRKALGRPDCILESTASDIRVPNGITDRVLAFWRNQICGIRICERILPNLL